MTNSEPSGRRALFSDSTSDHSVDSDESQATRSISVPRLDPQGKGALFDTPVQAPDDLLKPGRSAQGKSALYSNDKRRPGTVIVECSDCQVRTRATLVELGLGLFPLSAWLPIRRHAHWMRCPACHEQRWCRIGWTE